MKQLACGLRAWAAALLVCQVGVLAATPLVLCRLGTAAEAFVACTCPDGVAGAECPMHKGQHSAGQADPGAHCNAGCGDQATAILSVSVAGVAVLRGSMSLSGPVKGGRAPLVPAESGRSLARPPLSPPPRA